MTQTVTIAAHFNGPPNSGNGGYSCGVAAGFIDGSAAVKLRAPPPLETPLDVIRTERGVVLRHGETDIAIAQPAALTLDTPPAPSFAAAARAGAAPRQGPRDLFRNCFICGPSSARGLHIHVGDVPGAWPGLTATTWTPRADLAAPDGLVAPEFLWGVLDCPTYWSMPRCGDLFAVLGSLTADIARRPQPGENLIVAAWPLGADGKKHRAASAIYDAAGAPIARAEALWIEVDPERFT